MAISIFFITGKFEDKLWDMHTSKENENQIPFIRELCKEKTESEMQTAEEKFRRYFLPIKRICERLEREDEEKVQIDKPDKYCDSSVPQNFD